MSRVKFGDVVKDVKINIDRLNNPYEYYVAGDHMDSEDLTIHRKGCFTTDDVGLLLFVYLNQVRFCMVQEEHI